MKVLQIISAALITLCIELHADQPSDLLKTLRAEKILPSERAKWQLNAFISTTHYSLSIPVCREYEKSDDRFFDTMVDPKKFRTYGDILQLLEQNGFKEKEIQGTIILQSPWVAGQTKLPLDTPSKSITFHGKLKDLLVAVDFWKTSLGIAGIVGNDMRNEDCSVVLTKNGTMRDLLAALASQNKWGWNVMYDAQALQAPKSHSTQIFDSPLFGAMNFFKLSTANR